MEEEPTAGAGPETTGNMYEEHERERHEHPRIYVASLSDYVNGVLHGEWIDAADDIDTVHEQIGAMLARSPTTPRAEEYAIHDYDNFGAYRVGEYEPIEKVTTIARGIAENGLAFAAWASQCEDAEQLDHFEDAFLGSYDSVTDYAEQILEDFGMERSIEHHVPESLQQYVRIDADAFGSDLIEGGDIAAVEHDDGVWIFEGRL